MAEAFGPYLVYEQIGVGGMATVHRAEQEGVAGFRKAVALKRMLPSVASNAKLTQAFIREARLASHLRHANVAQTYDLGKVDETYFIAMELVPGKNLREILVQCAGTVGVMPLPIVLNILIQIAEALDYAHDLCDDGGQPLGIIHRDVSPSNVIVSDGGVVKLIDFGIAKASAQGMQTQSGQLKGKFNYMAPEYLEGRLDARADLFAFGVIAHELLVNKPLFPGADDMSTIQNVMAMPVPSPTLARPELPHEIESIVMTALARDPDKRWQKANALRNALTSETQRLGLRCLNSAVSDWVEWAFQQQGSGGSFHVDTEPSIVVERAPAEPTLGGVLSALDDDFSNEASTVARPSRPLVPTPAVRPNAPDEPSRLWFALVIVLVAGTTAAVVYFALPYFT